MPPASGSASSKIDPATFFRDGDLVPDGLPLDVAQLPLQLLAALHLRHELALEDRHVRIQVDELFEKLNGFRI